MRGEGDVIGVRRAFAVAATLALVVAACTPGTVREGATTTTPAADSPGYWYNGHVYAGNTALQGDDEPVTHRGFDVFTVDHPVLRKAIRLSHLNAQTQEQQQGRTG
jgi:hypothetical protein